jgi:hypothetical protein
MGRKKKKQYSKEIKFKNREKQEGKVSKFMRNCKKLEGKFLGLCWATGEGRGKVEAEIKPRGTNDT